MDMEKGPGKFEGEPTYTRHFWMLTLEGLASEEFEDGDTTTAVFTITPEDAEAFPDLAEYVGQYILLWETDLGFVCHQIATSAELEQLQREAETDTIGEEV